MSVPIRRQWFVESRTEKIKSDYDFLAEIGRGIFGRVFQAKHKETGDMRAIKVFVKALAPQVESFATEISILRPLDHPNIVNIIETYEDEQFLYLVLEYCSGNNIVQRITRDGIFSEQRASWIMRQIFSALIYCHNYNIMHLDIKPDNCIYVNDSPDSDIKLIDFGLSSFIPSETEIANCIRGTPYYMAPEVLSNQACCKSDCWSAGVMLYYLLSGKHPFTGSNSNQVLFNVRDGAISFQDPVFKSISNEAKYLIAKLVHKDVNTRFTAEQAYNHPWIKCSDQRPYAPLPQEVIDNMTRFTNAKEMRQAALMYIACKLNEDELNGLKTMFRQVDGDGDGFINSEELQRAIMTRTSIPNRRLEFIVNGIDMNKNGIIDYREFIASCLGRQTYRNINKAKNAFRHFDIDRNGFITSDELRRALFQNEEFGFERVANVENMIIDADINGDGRIDYLEFLALLSINSQHSLN